MTTEGIGETYHAINNDVQWCVNTNDNDNSVSIWNVHAAVTQLPTLTPVPLRPRKSFGVRS